MKTPALLRSLCAATGLALVASPLTADTVTVSGAPVGVLSAALPAGNSPLAFPLQRDEAFAGVITANAGDTVTFTAGTVAAQLVASGLYYLEVVTGNFEGERLDLNTAGTISAGGSTVKLNLAATSFSTSSSLAANSLANARAVIRPHVTLKDLPAMFSPTFVGNANAALADGVQIYRTGVLVSYYLRPDGSWRESGKAVDERNKVIPPDSSLLVQLRSGAKRWTQAGDVRSNVFRIAVTAGSRILATGFPLNLTPVQIGAFVDLQDTPSLRWVGNDNPALADNLKIYNPATNAFVTYYLRGDGTSWYQSGGSTNVATTELLNATGLSVLTRVNADPGYLILRPFSL